MFVTEKSQFWPTFGMDSYIFGFTFAITYYIFGSPFHCHELFTGICLNCSMFVLTSKISHKSVMTVICLF